MELLRLLTLVYTGVLVAALAGSLVAVWVYLRRIGRALGEVREELERVPGHTEPLHEHLKPLKEETAGAAEAMQRARDDLEQAERRLAAVAERLGIYERT